ncbi:MAG: murein biosynthesis integral membrane protein MurJ [Planctomycetes bacterium]|nr:murein biosynthesis integral membrane protein MurJ [Planctomycetota bacterium]
MTSTLPPTTDSPAKAPPSTARRVGIASLIWGASILLSRVIGLVREGVIGRTLGAEAQGDLYATAFVVPDFLNYLLAGGALSIVFIPIFGAYLARGEEERASQAFSVVANFLLVLLGVATAALWLAMPALAPIAAPGFTAAQLDDLVWLSRIVLPAQVFHVVGGLLSASIQARDRHALPALAPLVYTLGIIVGGLVGGASAGPYGFAWGALAGSVLGPFALPLYGALKYGLRWRWTFSLAHPDLRKYLLRSLPIMIGFSIVVVDDWYLKREGTLLGTGAAAILSYAKTLMKVPMGVFGLAAGVAVFPTLQRLVAEGRRDEMHALLQRTLRNVLMISFAAQVVLTVAGADIVQLVYGRTKLTLAQVQDVATSLSLVSIGLAAWATQALVARGFYALGNTWTPAVLGTGIAVVSYPFYIWARSSYGLIGLALTSSFAILAYTLALAWLLQRKVAAGAAQPSTFTSFALRALLSLALGILAGKLALALCGLSDDTLIVALRAGGVSLISLAVFALAAHVLRIEEMRTLAALLARRRTPS